MNNFGLQTGLVVGAWLILGVKLVYDQMRLFSAYKKYVDKKFSLSPIGTNHLPKNPTSVMEERLNIMFGHHLKYPEVDRLAKRARIDVILFAVAFVVFAFANFFWL